VRHFRYSEELSRKPPSSALEPDGLFHNCRDREEQEQQGKKKKEGEEEEKKRRAGR